MAKETGDQCLNIDDLISRETFKQLCLEKNFYPEIIAYLLKECPSAIPWISTDVELPEADFEEYFARNGEYPSYMVKIREGVEAAMLHFDGEVWHDERGEVYVVDYWQHLLPVPKE